MFKYFAGDYMKKRSSYQGIGRMTEEQQFFLYQKAVTYLNDILGIPLN